MSLCGLFSEYVLFLFCSVDSTAGCPDEIVLIRIKALSLNMCLRQAGSHYNATNIEFHFLSGSGGKFVAAGALSI